MKHPNVYIGDAKRVDWKTDQTPDDDQDRGMPREVIQILGFDPTEETMQKAKYTRRYRGPDGKWRYEYGQKKESGGQAKAEIARKERVGEPVAPSLFDEAYAEKKPAPTGPAYAAQKEAILDSFMSGSMAGEDRLLSYGRSFGKPAALNMLGDIYNDGALSDMDYRMAQRAIEKLSKAHGGYGMSDIALVVTLEGLEKLEKAYGEKHPAKLSKVTAKAETNNPSNHKERMKFARMFAQMQGSSKPEDESAHQPSTVDHKGRVAGQKAPHDKGSTKVSGMGSQAHDNFGSRIMKPSEIGSSPYKNPSTGGTVASKK